MTAPTLPQCRHHRAAMICDICRASEKVTSKPTAEDWEQAVSNIFAHYPPDIFPPGSDSLDAKAGTWARKVCLNIITEAWRIRTDRAEAADHRRWHGPADCNVIPPENGSTLQRYDGSEAGDG